MLKPSWKTDLRDMRLEPGSWARMLLQESMSEPKKSANVGI